MLLNHDQRQELSFLLWRLSFLLQSLGLPLQRLSFLRGGGGVFVLSAVEVGVSAAKLVSSPRSKKSSSPKKQLPASEYEIVEASQSSCVATCPSASTKASPASSSGASQAISLPEPRGSPSKGLQLVILVVVEVHRSEDLGSKALCNKRLCAPSSSPPLSPTHSKHFLKKVGKSLEDLSTSRVSKSPSSSEKTKKNCFED